MIKMIPEGWVKIKLGDIGKFSTSSVDKKSIEGEEEVCMLNYMDIYNHSTLTEDYPFEKVTAPRKQVLSSSVQRGDVFFTPSSETPDDIGHSAVFIGDLENIVHSYHTIRFRSVSNEYLDDHFKSHVFQGVDTYEYFRKRASGSTRFTLSLPVFNELELTVPSLPEQKKIASILNSVDEVIEKTQSKINKLQDLKKGMMNELLTKGIGHTEFKDSELGKIPKSWKVLDFQKIIQSSNQGVNTATEKVTYSAEGIKACRSNNIKENSFDWNNKKFVNKSTYARLTNKVKPKLNDVLYCNIGSNLGAATVVDTPEDFIITWNVLRITTENNKISPYFLSLSLNSLRKELMGFATESTMPFISSKALSKFKFRIPPLDEQKKISKVINGIGNNIDILKLKIHQTKSLKKSLMQDLLTGKVRVKVN